MIPRRGRGFARTEPRSEQVCYQAVRELDATRIRRLGFKPADPRSIRNYLEAAGDLDDDDRYPWHQEYAEADNRRRTDAGEATINSVQLA